jgi:hypothetical protein
VAIQLQGNGNFSIEYEGPYLGLDVQKPATLISDKASPAMLNMMLRNAEIRSRPAQLQFATAADNKPILGLTNFVDINGTYHFVYWAGQRMFQYNPVTFPNPFDIVGNAAPGDMKQNTVQYRAFANKIFYTTLSQQITPPQPGGGGVKPGSINPFVGYWDGIAGAPVFTQTQYDASVTQSIAGIAAASSAAVSGTLAQWYPKIIAPLAGPLALGAQFLGELNNQIILANVNMLDQATGTIYNLPNLIWWSANGLPFQWDPTQNTSAGFNALFDVSDLITGLMTMGVAGYLFRSYGISQFSPSGSAVAPFQFNHLWASEHGIGNVLPWSIAQYGSQGAFISQDNIYSLGLTNVQQIGGTARDAIMQDLADMIAGASFSPGTAYAAILPIFKKGYVYLTYQIFIPFEDFMRMWVYSFEDKNWMKWELPINDPAVLTPVFFCPPNVV